MIKVGVVGYGYWGPNMVRNFAEAPGSSVAYVSDLNPKKLELARKRYPAIRTTSDYREILADPEVDAVVIATPVFAHYEIAMGALQAGKHVLVEKPMTTTSRQAVELIEAAEKNKRVLTVDHTFVYTGAVRKIQELIASNALGDIYYYDSVRINLGLFQHDVNVIMDLAVHDLAIMDYTMKLRPRTVSAIGVSHIPGKPEDVAYLTLFFEVPLIAHIHINWLSPVKIRRTIIGGSSKMVIYDDLEPSEKIKIYDSGITVSNDDDNRHNLLIGYRTGDMLAPQLKVTEALSIEAQHFCRCIEQGEKPVVDGAAGLRIVRMLEAANESLAKNGQPVELGLKE